MIIYLLIYLIVLLLLLYIVHKRDILSPSIILVFVYIISIIFTVINWDLWRMRDFSIDTALLIGVSLTVFSLIGIIMHINRRKKINMIVKRNTKYSIKEIRLNIIFVLINTMICILTLIWLFYIVQSTGIFSNEFTQENYTLQTPFLLNIMQRYVRIQGYFFAILLMNNVISRKFKTSDIWIITFITSTILLALLNGTRLEILKIAATLLISGYLFFKRKNGWNKQINTRIIIIGSVSLLLLLIIFYQLRFFKSGNSEQFTPIYYLSMYIGAPIKLLDLYISAPPINSDIFGLETFSTLHSNLVTLGLENFLVSRHLEFRGIDNIHLGNVYGAIRRYHRDFGIGGAILMFSILSFVFHKIYFKIKTSRNENITFTIIFYCFIFSAIPLIPIDDVFFSELSVGYAINIIFLYVFYLWLFRNKIKL